MRDGVLQAEQAVLGAMLIDSRCVSEVMKKLRPDDFSIQLNSDAFSVIQRMAQGGEVIDPVTVLHQLDGADSQAGKYLMQLMQVTPTSANVAEYCDIVLDAARRRALRNALTAAAEQLDGSGEDSVVPGLEAAIDRYNERAGTDWLTPMEQVERFFAHRARIDSGAEPFVRTGFKGLDKLLGGGLLDNGLYFLAARPAMGKTSFALAIGEYAARKAGNVLFISLEMDDEQLTAKRVAALAKVNYQDALNGALSPEQYSAVAAATVQVGKSRIYINRSAGASAAKISAMCRAKKNVRLVIIDHFSLIQVPGRHSRYEEYTAVSGTLKRLARAMHCPVLCLAQLSRANEQRGKDKRPMLSDLRDTGAAEQDADGVLMLHRPDYYDINAPKREPGEPSLTEVYVKKNRHGGTGKRDLSFYPETSQFREVYQG